MPQDDDFISRSSLFSKTLEFAGVFEAGALQSPQISIEVTYSTINGHPPKGIVRGTGADYRDLETFFLTKRSPLCALRNASAERDAITCDEVLIQSIGERMFAKDERSVVHQILGRFSIRRLEIRRSFKSKSEVAKRRATFYLTGPSKLWMTVALRTLSWSGNTTADVRDEVLILDSAAPDTVSARPHYAYAEPPPTGADHNQTVQAELFALSIDDGKPDEGDETFFARATALVESLCLLVGFLSKAPITWFASMLSSPDVLVETFRDEKTVDAEAPRWEDVVIYAEDIRSFLNVALAAYTKSDIEVRLPMLQYISAQSSRFVEEGFTFLFFALEKLLSSLDDRNREPLLLTKGQLSALWEIVRPALAKMQKTPDQMCLIEQKRSELQRPRLKHRIKRHLADLGIDTSDIGGDEGLGRMIRVRNRLTHRHGEVQIEDIMVETRRLETIVERMLLKLLKWEGRTHTPTSGNWPIEEAERKNVA